MQRTVFFRALVLLLTFVVSCAPPKEKKEDIIAANKELDNKFIEAFRTRSVEVLMATYHNSPTTMEIESDGTLLQGYDAIKKYYEEFFASMESIEGQPTEADHAVYDGCVVGTGKFTMTIKPAGGDPMQMAGRYMDVREKHDGKWLFVKNVIVMEQKH
jgi:ketosteroid isomerase-like protein